MRHIILHNHLFKNAGTSVDQILKRNFGDRWVSREFDTAGPANTSDVTRWIEAHPQAIAFSSHTLVGPLPEIPGVRIVPVVLLRDPVERIGSAYRFERVQEADTFGTGLARKNGFAGYVHARLAVPGDRQCLNFQTQRLAALGTGAARDELEEARAVCDQIVQKGVLGLVAEFTQAMERLGQIVKPQFPDFNWHTVMANASAKSQSNGISPDMRQMLEEINGDDIALLRHAKSLIHRATNRTVCSSENADQPFHRVPYRGAV